MKQDHPNRRLGRISTPWPLVYRSNHAQAGEANAARHQLLARYGGAVRRSLRKVLRDADAADEVLQEFALQVVHGDLRGADPRRGRFRHFVRRSARPQPAARRRGGSPSRPPAARKCLTTGEPVRLGLPRLVSRRQR